jgi:hypothetical protein
MFLVRQRTVVAYWDVERQQLTYTEPGSRQKPARQRKVSIALKRFGRRYIVPRVGYDNAYQLFYHSYQAFQVLRRIVKTRRQPVLARTAPAAEATPDPATAGTLLQKAFRNQLAVRLPKDW